MVVPISEWPSSSFTITKSTPSATRRVANVCRGSSGVGLVHAEANPCAGIRDHCVGRLGVAAHELAQVLVRGGGSEAILPRSGERRRNGRRDEVVKLVNMGVEVSAPRHPISLRLSAIRWDDHGSRRYRRAGRATDKQQLAS